MKTKQKKQLIPQLRFPEFEGEWDKRNFKELVKINQGLQISISDRLLQPKSGSLFYITNEFLNPKSNKRFFIENAPKSVICDEDDILMTRTGNTGKVVTNVSGAFHNNFFRIAYPKTINKMFLYNFLILPKTQNFIQRLAGTSTIPDLNHSDFYKIKFIYPYKKEQQKIANFLSSIDTQLQTLEKKKEALEQYKKGVTQKIFKQEIRFKDDDGNAFPEWEKRKFNYFLTIPEKITPKQIDPQKILTVKLHLKGVHLNKRTDSLKIGSTKYIVRQKGQFLYGKQNLFNGAFAILPEKFDGFLSSGDVPALDIDNSKVNSKFFYYFLARSSFYNRLESIASGSGSKRIHEKTLLELKIKLPSPPEQTKIANFLSSIDQQIEVISQQIQHTKAYKKGLLQQMFV